MDPHRRPTQPHPLLEMHQRDDGTYSDFPSFREHESTPSPPAPTPRRRSPPSLDPQSSRSEYDQSQRPKPELGSKNRVNTLKASKSLLKRNSATLNVPEDRPLKKKRVVLVDHNDMHWLKSEINSIKDGIREIVERLRELDD